MPWRRFDDTGVMCSTLSSLPGMTVIDAKSIIFGTSSISFLHQQTKARHTGAALKLQSSQLAPLLTQGHAQLKQQAAAMGCNAVIGITIAICSDSSGGGGQFKVAVVTACGTPCFLVEKSK